MLRHPYKVKTIWQVKDQVQRSFTLPQFYMVRDVVFYNFWYDVCNCVLWSFWQDLAAKIDQATEAGEQFAKLYYETYDKKRHVSKSRTL